jgi:phosphoglycerate dehydrogenase-like enzyme
VAIAIGFDPDRLGEGRVSRIEEDLAGEEFIIEAEKERLLEAADRIEIACGLVPPTVLRQLPELAWYHSWSAGVDNVLSDPDLAQRDFLISNTSGLHAVPMSEHILGLLLCHTRNLHRSIRGQESKEWRQGSMADMRELAGSHVLIVGMGAIGEHFARVARALDMSVTGVRRSGGESPVAGVKVVTMSALDDALGRADFVILILPHTEETIHVIDAGRLSLMKPDSILVNVGRGSAVDEEALFDALAEGRIGGASLDVFEKEPLPEDSPLWGLENLVVSPHNAGFTPAYWDRAWSIFMENLRAFRAGTELPTRVGRERGY